MGAKVEIHRMLRITNRRARALVERIVRQGLTFGSGNRPLRSFRILEIKKLDGSDYFVGLNLDELEFKELTFAPEDDFK
jgi:hypothetical protein